MYERLGWIAVITLLLLAIALTISNIDKQPDPPKYYRVIGENWIALMEYDGRLWFTFDMEGK